MNADSDDREDIGADGSYTPIPAIVNADSGDDEHRFR